VQARPARSPSQVLGNSAAKTAPSLALRSHIVPLHRVDAGVPEQSQQDGQVAPLSRTVKSGPAILHRAGQRVKGTGIQIHSITGGPMGRGVAGVQKEARLRELKALQSGCHPWEALRNTHACPYSRSSCSCYVGTRNSWCRLTRPLAFTCCTRSQEDADGHGVAELGSRVRAVSPCEEAMVQCAVTVVRGCGSSAPIPHLPPPWSPLQPAQPPQQQRHLRGQLSILPLCLPSCGCRWRSECGQWQGCAG